MRTTATISILAMGWVLGAVGCTADASDSASDETSDLRKGPGDDDGSGSGGSGGVLQVRCYQDADHDGFGGSTSQLFNGRSTCPAGWFGSWTDCNDADASVFPRTCLADLDHDGFAGSAFTSVCTSACPVYPGGDCNDNDATTFPRSCGVDRDGDGYSVSATQCVASCAMQSGTADCDDGNASTHPNRHEIAANAIDDNCNDMRDEAEQVFDHGSSAYESPTSLEVHFFINDATAIGAAQSGTMFARLTYVSLASSRTTITSPWLPVTLDGTSPPSGHVVLDGLSPSSIYMGSFAFARDAQGANLLPPAFSASGVQAWGTGFRAMTLASSADRITQIRPVLVNNAFALMDDRANATGALEAGPQFYGDITSPWFESMNVSWLSPWPSCSSITDAFQNHGGAYLTGNLVADLTGSARAGDALPAYDTWSSCGDVETFLTYDASTNEIWTIQDGTFIGGHPFTSTFANGIGVLEAGMLK